MTEALVRKEAKSDKGRFVKAELLDSRFPNLPNRLTTDEIVRRAARRKAERGRMKTQNPTTAATQFKAELWTTVSGPSETREVWATIMLNGPDKGWLCAFGPKEKMEQYSEQLNASKGVFA